MSDDNLLLHYASFMGDIHTVKSLINEAANLRSRAANGQVILPIDDLIKVNTMQPHNANDNSSIAHEHNMSSTTTNVSDTLSNNNDEQPQTTKPLWSVADLSSIVDAYGCTAVHEAARSGHAEIISLLVEEGGHDPNAKCFSQRTPLHEACKFGHFEGAQLLMGKFNSDPRVADERGRDALHYAAANGRTELVNLLLRTDGSAVGGLKLCDPSTADRRGNTALHLAAARGHTDVVKALLEKPVPLLDRASKQESFSSFSCGPTTEARLRVTPIHLAAANGHTETLRVLIASALQDNATRKGDGRGMTAATNDNIMSPVDDAEHNEVLNRRDTLGRTPFFMAACGDWEEAMHLLKSLGCDQHITDNKGRSPNA